MRTNLFPNFTPPLGRRALIAENALSFVGNMSIELFLNLRQALLAFIGLPDLRLETQSACCRVRRGRAVDSIAFSMIAFGASARVAVLVNVSLSDVELLRNPDSVRCPLRWLAFTFAEADRRRARSPRVHRVWRDVHF